MSRPFVGIGVPLVVRFGPADVGRRVTLRRRLPDAPEGGPSLGDVVGVLDSWEAGMLRLTRRTGETVEVPAITVVAGRVVAPERSADDVALLADDTWRPRESAELGQWRLRAHGGVTHRANSTLAIGDPGMPLLDSAAEVDLWYRSRGLPPNVMTALPSPAAAAYRVLGWREESRTLVLWADLTAVVRGALGSNNLVEVSEELPDDWSDVLARLRDDAVAPLYRELLTGTPGAGFATVRDETTGTPAAVARGAISDGWLNLTNVEVLPEARRRGLAAAMCGALAGWALERRATHGFLQLWPDNEPALRLYERLGFTRHHEYAYYVAPDVPEGY